MTAEDGHHAGRAYLGQDGAFYLNGAAFYDAAGEDISGLFELFDASNNMTGVNRITQGAFASLIQGSGSPLASGTPFIHASYADDAGANIGASVRNILARTLLTVDQSGGSIRSVMGQLKLATGVDVTTGIYTGVQGYLELVGATSAQTGATFSCFDASAELGGVLTIDSGGEFCALHVETTGSGTIVNNGICAGVLIDKASGAASWPDGILVDGPSVIMGMRIGKFAGGAATTSAVLFATTQDIYSDGQLSTIEVHGASSSNLTSAFSAKCGRFRHVVNATTAAHETYGLMGQVVVKDTTLTHLHSGLIGTFEGHTSGVVVNGAYAYSTAAVMARVGGGASITATKPLSGFTALLNGADVDSGISAAYSLGDTGTAPWQFGIGVERCTELFRLPASGTVPVAAGGTVGTHGSGTLKIAIDIGGSTYQLLASVTPTFT